MSETTVEHIRCIGIMAHIDAGKTTTSERLLFFTGRNHRIGEVHEGNATMDWMPEEQNRGITITSAATTVYWKEHEIQLIDTPGHVDFTVEVERALRVLDGAILVLDASRGVEPQTETVWKQSTRYNIPILVFINKMDKTGTNPEMCLEQLKNKLGANPVPLQIPILESDRFLGCIDLLERQLIQWTEEADPQNMSVHPIPSHIASKVEQARTTLIESLCDHDEKLMSFYLEGEEIATETLKQAIRQQTLHRLITPVIFGSAFKNKGIQSLLDAICSYLPCPTDLPAPQGIDPKTEKPKVFHMNASSPFSAILFKNQFDPYTDFLSYIRIYSGECTVGDSLWNPTVEKHEKIFKIFRMHANKREEIQRASAGDIITVVGLKHSKTGHTLCHKKDPILYTSFLAPIPVVQQSLEPRFSQDYDKLLERLNTIAHEDPSFNFEESSETGQLILTGMGELHLEIIASRLKTEFNIPVRLGQPQVAYKEILIRPIEFSQTCQETFQDRVYQIDLTLTLSPQEELSNKAIINRDVLGIFPSQTIRSFEEIISHAISSGGHGYPLIQTKCELKKLVITPQYHDIAVKTTLSKTIHQLLTAEVCEKVEPVMQVVIVTPLDYTGRINTEIHSRKGQIFDIITRDQEQEIYAYISLKQLFGFETQLRSLSQGRAASSSKFHHYGKTSEINF